VIKVHLDQRIARKKKSMKAHPDRNARFEKIAELQTHYVANANAETVISLLTAGGSWAPWP
jgi:curved DNA-binding protein CbpA